MKHWEHVSIVVFGGCVASSALHFNCLLLIYGIVIFHFCMWTLFTFFFLELSSLFYPLLPKQNKKNSYKNRWRSFFFLMGEDVGCNIYIYIYIYIILAWLASWFVDKYYGYGPCGFDNNNTFNIMTYYIK